MCTVYIRSIVIHSCISLSPSADGRDGVDSVLQLPINTEMLKKKKTPQSPFCFPNAVTVYTSATSLYWLQGCSGSTDPLLIDVGQEAAVLLVEIIVQRVMPVLGLHQTDNHKHKRFVTRCLTWLNRNNRHNRLMQDGKLTAFETSPSKLPYSELHESCHRF